MATLTAAVEQHAKLIIAGMVDRGGEWVSPRRRACICPSTLLISSS